MELNEENRPKRGRPLGSKKRKKGRFTRMKKHKISANVQLGPSSDDINSDPCDNKDSFSKYHPWNTVPLLTFKEEPCSDEDSFSNTNQENTCPLLTFKEEPCSDEDSFSNTNQETKGPLSTFKEEPCSDEDSFSNSNQENTGPLLLTFEEEPRSDEDSFSNFNQENAVPHTTVKEEPLDEEEITDCPQDSKKSVFQTTIGSSDSGNDDLIRAAGCEDAPKGIRNPSAILHGLRMRRSSKKKAADEHCPICGLTLREPDLETHYVHEMERLTAIPRKYKKLRNENGVNDSFVQVKCNRENRVTAKLARCIQSAPKKVQCPICKDRITGSETEINDHVVCCAETDTHVDVEDDDDESYEELEIGDETRIRTASLIPGGYRSLFGQSCVITNGEDSDIDIEVDADDTEEFGSPQYSELDVISNFNPHDEKSELLKRSVMSNPDTKPKVITSRKWSDASENAEVRESSFAEQEAESNETKEGEPVSSKNECDLSEDGKGHSKILIDSLREKIRLLETLKKNCVTCLICLEPYSTPVVSTTCWHVHCEECWLKNMGEKKLCPQCNMIVFPSNLRKIYL